MRPAEIFLRVGAGFGGWMIGFGYAVVIAVVPRAECRVDSDELWLGTFVFGLLAIVGAGTIGAALRWRDSLKWLACAVVPLLLYDAIVILPALTETTFSGHSLCGVLGVPKGVPGTVAEPTSGLQTAWAPLQFMTIIAIVVQSLRFWRSPAARDVD